MIRCWNIKLLWPGAAFGWLAGASVAQACTACYGQSDSLLAQGMNWGIFALLGVVLTVLSGIVAFFVHVARRTAGVGARPDSSPSPESTPEI